MLFRFGPIFAIIMLGVVSSGCLFEPRDPAPPGTNVIQYLDPSDPDNVLENLERSLNGLDPAGYERMLSDDFVYEPDGDTMANYPAVDWESWDRAKEVAFVTSFLSNVTGVEANWMPRRFSDIMAQVPRPSSDTSMRLRYRNWAEEKCPTKPR